MCKNLVDKILTPMAVAAEQFLGSVGVVIVAITAVLALTSMANAGLLSSSRYPFAMSRESLAPPLLKGINGRFGTPVFSIGLTGLVLLLLIGFVPVVDLAKFASAFQILVFCMVNLALIFLERATWNGINLSFGRRVIPGSNSLVLAAGYCC